MSPEDQTIHESMKELIDIIVTNHQQESKDLKDQIALQQKTTQKMLGEVDDKVRSVQLDIRTIQTRFDESEKNTNIIRKTCLKRQDSFDVRLHKVPSSDTINLKDKKVTDIENSVIAISDDLSDFKKDVLPFMYKCMAIGAIICIVGVPLLTWFLNKKPPV